MEAKIEATTEDQNQGKPWYRKVKVLIALADAILTIATVVIGEIYNIDNTKIIILVSSLLTLGIAVITGHTVTDINAMMKNQE